MTDYGDEGARLKLDERALWGVVWAFVSAPEVDRSGVDVEASATLPGPPNCSAIGALGHFRF
jgi:hypothetical protein